MEVWQEILRDKERGARSLVTLYRDRVYAVALSLCHDPIAAEDLVFRTFSQVVDKIRSFKPNSSFYNWIYAILLNFRRMDLRKANRDRLVLFEEPPETEDVFTPAMEVAAKADAAAIRRAVDELSEPLREVVLLRYFEDMSLDEISEVAELPLGTVKSRLNYAKTVLAKSLMMEFQKEV